LGKIFNAEVVGGVVRFRPRGSSRFVTLSEEGRQIPFGAQIDVTRGTVRITVAKDEQGGTYEGDFSAFAPERLGRRDRERDVESVFRITHVGSDESSDESITELSLEDGPKALAAKKGKKPVRSLWGDGKGRFRTKGRHASATVRGTTWLTEDRCDGTFVEVAEGSVTVEDFAPSRSELVSQGQSHLSRSERSECGEEEVAAETVRNSAPELPATGFSGAVGTVVGSLLVAARVLLVTLTRRQAASDAKR